MMYIRSLTVTILGLLFIISCRETEQFTESPSAKLSFSTDTVQFDTVFTTVGSTTHQFRFYNPNNEAVKTTISLAGGAKSFYRLNIDGESTRELRDYEIMPNDSAYIFVEVNVDPQNSNNPMVIDDSIMFYTNGNQQNVKLQAYGQDVHLYKDSVIDTRTWIADKPYLIYNSILVDSDETLTIEAGAKIYFHNESAMWVLGSLNVKGTAEENVIFQGDRLEDAYEYFPGQWYGYYRNDSLEYLTGGIHFWQGSKDNIINHAIIKNGVKGVQVDYMAESEKPTLTISNSIIKNMSSVGLMAQTSNVLVSNTVIANCGYYAVLLLYGGHYEFYQSTIGNYYKFEPRKTPSLVFNNYYTVNEINTAFNFSATFGNCIIYGDQENEFVIDFDSTGGAQFGFLFDHCMMKLEKEFDTSNEDIFKEIIRDKDSLPRFVDSSIGDFRLDTLSAAKDKGSSIYSNAFPIDQDGINRNADGKPDLGAYERIEGEGKVK